MSNDRDTAGVILPPPLLLLAALIVGLALGYLWPLPFASASLRYPVAAVLAVAGAALAGTAMLGFRRAGTPVEPWRTTTALVVEGPYRFSRNPIYAGGALVYVALALVLDEAWLLIALVPSLVALHYGVILREERYLETKFGDDYRRYKTQVKRWL
jgi:protein-S-isoprenylcysteine O-methyltransferase Ste14